jgi:DNA-binding XRE family transcriptional regulator
MASKLPNYLKTFRKRSGLSQEEVAFLLGTLNGEKVCRHERFAREPSLRTALAYMIIFQSQGHELFAGIHEEVRLEIVDRARKLKRKRESSGEHKPSPHRADALDRILSGKLDSNHKQQCQIKTQK